MASSHMDESLAAIVTAVDVVVQRQGASTHRGASRAYDLALESLQVAEFWMERARPLDEDNAPPPIYDDQGRREELKPESVWRWEKT